MAERNVLPNRRGCESFELPYGGLAHGHIVTFGQFPDGNCAEIFISGGKSGEVIQAIAIDFGTVTSLALQYGCPLEVIQHAIARDPQNNPQSILGVAVDAVAVRLKS